MLKTWLAYHQGRRNELPSLLEQLEAHDRRYRRPAEKLPGWRAKSNAVRSLILFHSGEIEEAVFQARAALEQVPAELWNVRSLGALIPGRVVC